MDVTNLSARAIRHWAEFRRRTADLKGAGTLEMRANQAAERAQAEIAALVQQGVPQTQAEELVLPGT